MAGSGCAGEEGEEWEKQTECRSVRSRVDSLSQREMSAAMRYIDRGNSMINDLEPMGGGTIPRKSQTIEAVQ